MNESIDNLPTSNDIVQWLQRKYIQVPGPVSINSEEIYNSYKHEHPDSLLQKRTIGRLVPQLFNTVSVVHQNGPAKFTGLRQNFFSPQPCSMSEISEIGSKFGFVKMNEEHGFISYICYSGYIVNNQKQIKTVKISIDRSVKILIGEKDVTLNDIGLHNISIKTTEDASIVFNTVKQAKVCCGKPVDRKTYVPKNSLLQQWLKIGDENTFEHRLSTNNCKGFLPFNAVSSLCSLCQKQNIRCSSQNMCCSDPQDNTLNVVPEEPDRLATLKSIFPGCNDLMLKILLAQSNICNSPHQNPRCRRWDKEIVQVCLTLWNRSPQAYVSLCSSGMLFLPSINLLQRYKNCFDQSPGINDNMLTWMYNEAKQLNVDMRGGIILDEMAIQEDLKMSFYGGQNTVDGIVDMGNFAEDLQKLNSHKSELRLATHILQFIFLSYDGFRFPFAYFPSKGANVHELYLTTWEAISKLFTYEFTIDYVCFDGASTNRAFQLMHFQSKEEAKTSNFTTKNPYGDNNVTFIMDYSHNIKKLRNNIHSSGDHDVCTRKLYINNLYIEWKHWIEAFNWYRSHNPMRIHQKLTNEHIFLTKVSKMRNHLAEDVLNKEMLHLMKAYRSSLSDGLYLDMSIELLEQTSAIIELFRDRRPISDLNDPRLVCLKRFENWLDTWLESVESLTDISASNRAKNS